MINAETARRRIVELHKYWMEHRQTCLARLNDPNATRQFERQAQNDLERIEALELAIQLLDKASA
jgi:hypothetical protein